MNRFPTEAALSCAIAATMLPPYIRGSTMGGMQTQGQGGQIRPQALPPDR